MNTYTWQILRVDVYPTLSNAIGTVFYDVIYACQWQITGTDINGNTASINDSMGFDIELTSNYTPRNEITTDQIVGWVQTSLGTLEIANLEAEIDQMIANIPSQGN